MKPYLLLSLIVLTGCQVAPNVPATTPPPRPAAMSRPASVASVPVTPSTVELERKLRQQTQYIEALLSQNDALRTKPAAPVTSTPLPATAPAAPMPQVAQMVTVPPPAAPVAAEEPALSPNADGVIDLAAQVAKPGEPVNPFAVRTAPDGVVREVLLHVSGLIAGPSACAVVNERLVQAGEAVDSFRVERVEADAVILRLGERRLRLPLSEKPVRVRLPN